MQVETRTMPVAQLLDLVNKGELDLQPDFQRGDVWSVEKKQKLIDTILRSWHVPPIHLIAVDELGKKFDVLDGQQRLTALFDFSRSKFKFKGDFRPVNPEFIDLHGLRCSELPQEHHKRFARFEVTVIILRSFAIDEPGELFARLNHPVSLSPAEQRNAYYGPVRHQIKELSAELEAHGSHKLYGFSNSRMAYEDVLARVCVTIESGSLLDRATASALRDRYQQSHGFDERTMAVCGESVCLLRSSWENATDPPRLNKATMFSWLIFYAEACLWTDARGIVSVGDSFVDFFAETLSRSQAKKRRDYSEHSLFPPEQPREKLRLGLDHPDLDVVLFNYKDRATSRVSDSLSIAIRDLSIWILAAAATDVVDHLDQLRREAIKAVVLDIVNGDSRKFVDIARHAITRERWGGLG